MTEQISIKEAKRISLKKWGKIRKNVFLSLDDSGLEGECGFCKRYSTDCPFEQDCDKCELFKAKVCHNSEIHHKELLYWRIAKLFDEDIVEGRLKLIDQMIEAIKAVPDEDSEEIKEKASEN